MRRVVEWLLGLLRKLLGLDEGPSPLKWLRIEGMSDVRLVWELPTPNAQQRAVDHVRVEARADGVSEWTTINEVMAPATELTVQDLAPGAWEFRGIVVDVDGAESTPVAASVDVPFAGPSPLVSFSAAVV